MHTRLKQMAKFGVLSAIVSLAVPPLRAADLTVDGNLSVNKDVKILGKARIDGGASVGVVASGANLHINQAGLGVGIFLGNREPFGQALFETDLTVPTTHAWFAENGERVFSVTAGGTGFFKGALVVDSDASVQGRLSILGDTRLIGNVTIGNPFNIGQVEIFANQSISGNESIDGNQSIGGGQSIRNSQEIRGTQSVGGGQAIGGTQFIGGGQVIGGTQSIGGSQTLNDNQYFGVQLRQMINLFDDTYGIGVQKFAFYQRTNNEFFWYLGGKHSDDFGNAGGGKQLMRLGNNGVLLVAGRVVTPVLEITGGTDVAEPFQMSDTGIPEGAVVIIDDANSGSLKMSERAYDKRVAGIVSGANGIKPGISLSQHGVTEGGQNVALSGRVYVLADASSTPIRPGDLLTTSDTPGHSMKVTDAARAQGAVIGKAMSALGEGKGTVLVLVTLQ